MERQPVGSNRCAEPPARCDSTAERLISRRCRPWPRPWRLAVPMRRALVAGPRRARPSPPEDHRSLRGGRAADGRQRPRPGHRVERLHLQLQEPAPRAVRARLPVLLPQRHRGAAEGLPPLGRPLRRPAVRDVRIRDRRAGQRPGAARTRPARHQAAVHHRGRQPRPVRLVAARAAGRRRHRHPHRPGGAAPLPHLPLGGPAAAARSCAVSPRSRPPRSSRSSRTAAAPPPRTGLRTSVDATTVTTGPKRTGKTRFSTRCGSQSTAAWSPTCRWAACCRAVSTPA